MKFWDNVGDPRTF